VGSAEDELFSIMPDCAPESSYHKQMSVIVRIDSNRKQEVMIEESFLLFISVDNTIGKMLCERVLQRLQEYDTLLFENFRGQGHNSGANVKKYREVRIRLLQIYRTALFYPVDATL